MYRLSVREPLLCDPALVSAIAEAEGVSALTARALIRRGVSSVEEAGRFLRPSELHFHDPYLLPDMERAVLRIRAAIAGGEPVCVFGDYDADGICAAAMLLGRLRALGANATCYIPLRGSEGYGLNEQAVRLIAGQGTRLLVTVDNGISAFDEIALSGALGMDVIVTDHHSAGKSVPSCTAVVSASRKDSTYPNPHLCGAGVAFKLIAALSDDAYSEAELALAAVATIADVVPLVGENRAIAACGLRQIAAVPGLTALLDAALWKQGRVDEQTVSFVLAPRLNAVGRMSAAMRGVELLSETEPARLKALAGELNKENQRRRDAEAAILEEARRRIAAGERTQRAIVLAHEGWNPGVIGIVASRLCETHHVPVLLFAGQEGVLTGSGRSIGRVNLYETLSRFSDRFLRYGGHARAAGVTMLEEEFGAFRAAFCAYLDESFTPADFEAAGDYEETLRLCALSLAQVKELARLAPFGEGNPELAFRFDGVRLVSPRTLGQEQKHLSASVVQDGEVLRAVAFGQGALLEQLKGEGAWELVARPSINAYRGSERVELLWSCANPSEEKNHFFDAFFGKTLYNECCSDDKLTEWYVSFDVGRHAVLDDEAMRRAYRALRTALAAGPMPLEQLIRTRSGEELFSLCVFAQLSFFTFDPDSGMMRHNAHRAPRALSDSSLYRLAHKNEEA